MPIQSAKSIAARCAFAACAAVAVLVAAPSLAGAQSLTGCYVPSSGTVYRIKAAGLPDSCRNAQHVEFTWSGQGPAGPAGPQGPVGPQGPAGPSGTISAAAVTVMSHIPDVPPGTSLHSVQCPAGKVAISAGGKATNELSGIQVIGSAPFQQNSVLVGWNFVVSNPLSVPAAAEFHVVCVTAQ
jgi:hypothetical protein